MTAPDSPPHPASPQRAVPVAENVTPAMFQEEILPAGRPVLLRGAVKDWPIVDAGRRSNEALGDYLRQFDAEKPIPTAFGPPSIRGRLFYNEDMSGLNFSYRPVTLSQSLDYLISRADQANPATLAILSLPTREYAPGFEDTHPMPLIGQSVEPRLWVGNRVTIAAHFDPNENIACCAAGRRRFTLFPPEQIANLYIGPFEVTPAGAQISLVDFDKPDLDRFPRFAEAMKAAEVADLEPGDAIYIPYLWWHHVRSREAVNMLVNYWWNDAARQAHADPRDALFHALFALRTLPPGYKQAWREMYTHYLFDENGPPATHIPRGRRGILGDLPVEAIAKFKSALARKLNGS